MSPNHKPHLIALSSTRSLEVNLHLAVLIVAFMRFCKSEIAPSPSFFFFCFRRFLRLWETTFVFATFQILSLWDSQRYLWFLISLHRLQLKLIVSNDHIVNCSASASFFSFNFCHQDQGSFFPPSTAELFVPSKNSCGILCFTIRMGS